MSSEDTRKTMQRYFDATHGDTSMLAEDVVFTMMGTGQAYRGREGVSKMLHDFYHVAFDATSTTRLTLYGENNAMLEGEVVGRHIGEFDGIPATGKSVHVPLCVVYDLENNLIKRGRIYFETSALLKQLGIGKG